jgi:hypothetical protein
MKFHYQLTKDRSMVVKRHYKHNNTFITIMRCNDLGKWVYSEHITLSNDALPSFITGLAKLEKLLVLE